MIERNLFEEIEEVEQLTRALGNKFDSFGSGLGSLELEASQLSQKLDQVLVRLNLAIDKLEQIITQLTPPVRPATSLVLTLGKPISQ